MATNLFTEFIFDNAIPCFTFLNLTYFVFPFSGRFHRCFSKSIRLFNYLQINSTDDDARKAMRLDGGKLKEIQVRLFLSSRAEMQEVIESARKSTMSLMQMQQPKLVPPTLPVASLTPQSPPQQTQALPMQTKLPQINPLTGLMSHDIYQKSQQPQIQTQINQKLPYIKANDGLDLVSSRRRRSRSYSRSYSRSKSRSRSRSRERSDRHRRRSRSPRSSRRGDKNRSHRDRSDSRERDRRRNRNNGSRNDKDSISNRGNNDKRSSSDIELNNKQHHLQQQQPPLHQQPPMVPNNPLNSLNPQLYQQNPAFTSNMAQFMMNKPQMMPMANTIDPNILNNLNQNEQMSAFSTNDVRTMNMNMTLQNNPLAFQQQLYNQQNVGMPAFNTFTQATNVLQNAQKQQQQQMPSTMVGQMNPFGTNNMNSNQSSQNSIHCVRVRNLCNLTNYSALRKFFSGLLIPNDGIKMINDADGNRTGQAYVRFVRPTSVQLAIGRGNNQKLGRNIIQVQELDEKVYEEAVDSYRPPRRNNYRSDDRDNDRERDRDRDRDRDNRRNNRYRRNSRDYSDSNDDDDDRNSSKGNSDNDRDNDVMCISDSNDSKEMAPFTTVLIEDLPPFTKEQDIMKLFSSYPLVHIVMAKRPKMFSSYVKFHSADDAKAAVKNTACHKISFKTVYISACSEDEFETARKEFSGELDLDIGGSKTNDKSPTQFENVDESNDIKSPNDHIPNINDASNDDSNNMNDIPKISLESIPGVNLADPRINPAKFPFAVGNFSADANNVAVAERIDPRTKIAMQALNPKPFETIDVSQDMMDVNNMLEVCCILVENMEYRTTEAEVIEWILEKTQLVAMRIQLLVNNRNQTNGNGFVQFANTEQAAKAVEILNNMQFKTRVVHVSLASWHQIQETITGITETLRENGFDGIDTSGNQQRPRFNNNGNNKHHNNARFNNGSGSSVSGSRIQNNRQNHRNNNNVGGCVVAMSNVPYKANLEDILDFFTDFDLRPDDVIRRYNDEGKPTGDARVRFENTGEARRAVDLRDRCRILNRPVYLSIL